MPSFSEERLAPANGIELAYQEMGDRDGEPLLLIMGLATQMLAWDDPFCSMLAERGFRVVRFDNRDIGCSTHVDELGVSSRADIIVGRRSTAPYLLRDMAADTTGLMDHLEIDSAHVVGASMGGMIAQTLAIEHPDRVRSLVSIMSTTGSRWVGTPAFKTFGLMLSDFPRDREAYVERAVKTFKVIGSPGFPMNEQRIRELAAAMHDRGDRKSVV
jgi:pimeloyl-ACP methyl ester carboxylesterase